VVPDQLGIVLPQFFLRRGPATAERGGSVVLGEPDVRDRNRDQGHNTMTRKSANRS
jgi:hypothetical protein